MIQNLLRLLGGTQGFGIVSLCLFCAVFTGVLLWAFLQRKSHLDYMSRVPLETEPEELSNPSTSHE
jgi:hypothetical protein